MVDIRKNPRVSIIGHGCNHQNLPEMPQYRRGTPEFQLGHDPGFSPQFEELTGIPGAFSTRIAYVAVAEVNGKRRHRLVVADADGANASEIADSSQPIMSPSCSGFR